MEKIIDNIEVIHNRDNFLVRNVDTGLEIIIPDALDKFEDYCNEHNLKDYYEYEKDVVWANWNNEEPPLLSESVIKDFAINTVKNFLNPVVYPVKTGVSIFDQIAKSTQINF